MKGTDGSESINMSSFELWEGAALCGDVKHGDGGLWSPSVSFLLQRILIADGKIYKLLHKEKVGEGRHGRQLVTEGYIKG